MITALAHISINAQDPAAAMASLEVLLARKPEGDTVQLNNLALKLSQSGNAEGLRSLAFTVSNADHAFRSCERRALKPAWVDDGIALDTEATHGVRISLQPERMATPSRETAACAVTGLDHVVVRTTHPNRAAALYGARLGLDMRLDRTEPKWGSRLMFFRCGDMIVEVVHNLNEPASDTPDALWGLSWRVADADAAHARLKSSGFDVSEIRTGRKPGTRVFTVRNNTLGVPTLMLQPASAGGD